MPLKDLKPLSSLHERECVSSVSLSGLLEISTVERGVVSLFGVKSTLFIAMNSKGRLYTTVSSLGEGQLRAAGGSDAHTLDNSTHSTESCIFYGRKKRGL